MASLLKKVSLATLVVLSVALIGFIVWPEMSYTPHQVTPEFRAEALALHPVLTLD